MLSIYTLRVYNKATRVNVGSYKITYLKAVPYDFHQLN